MYVRDRQIVLPAPGGSGPRGGSKTHGKIVEIDALLDPERLEQLDLGVSEDPCHDRAPPAGVTVSRAGRGPHGCGPRETRINATRTSRFGRFACVRSLLREHVCSSQWDVQ
jgi:hypothetical protein